jgi:hypothetical protein
LRAILAGVLLAGCTTPEPNFVEVPELHQAHARGEPKVICAGLKMDADGTRQEAAKILRDWHKEAPCLCERLQREGRWDAAILAGLADAERDDRVGCVAELLDDPTQPDRAALVEAMLHIEAPAVKARVLVAAKSEADPEVRAAAMIALRGSKDPADVSALVDMMTKETNPSLRAAAARALSSVAPANDALLAAVKGDADPGVRAAAVGALTGLPGRSEGICAALADADAQVRAAAATAGSGTRDAAVVTCLAKKLDGTEEAGEARAAVLGSLRKSPLPEAAKALCDAIPGWVRAYVKDKVPERFGDLDIAHAQNDRDFEQSYDCMQKAVRAGGYTQCGKAYVTDWFQQVGGKVSVATCGPVRVLPRRVIYTGTVDF